MAGRIEALIPVVAPERIDELEALIDRIVDDVEAGRSCDALIAQVNAAAGEPRYDRVTFLTLYGWADHREFAEQVAMGRPPTLPNMTLPDVVECLEIISAGKEPRCWFCLCILDQSFPHLPISDMIFYPERELPIAELAADILRR